MKNHLLRICLPLSLSTLYMLSPQLAWFLFFASNLNLWRNYFDKKILCYSIRAISDRGVVLCRAAQFSREAEIAPLTPVFVPKSSVPYLPLYRYNVVQCVDTRCAAPAPPLSLSP